jgi:hypothetical protein
MAVDVKPHKRGAPLNHLGTNRPKIETPNERHIHGKECPGCLSKKFKIIGHKLQQQEEIPPEIQPEATNIIRDICQCDRCHLKFFARDDQTPLQGKFGINLMVLVIFLKFIVRGVLRKTSSFLEASFALKLAPASVQAIIERAAQAGEKEYAALKENIRAARLLYIDETSFRFWERIGGYGSSAPIQIYCWLFEAAEEIMCWKRYLEKVMLASSSVTAGEHMIFSAMLFSSDAGRICCANQKSWIVLLADISTKNYLLSLMRLLNLTVQKKVRSRGFASMPK